MQPREARREYIISPDEHVLETMANEPSNSVGNCDFDHALAIQQCGYVSEYDLTKGNGIRKWNQLLSSANICPRFIVKSLQADGKTSLRSAIYC